MSDFDPRFDPAYQPGFDPAKQQPLPSAPRPRTELPVVEERPVAEQPVSPVLNHEPAVAAPHHRNPLLVTLWVLSALFVVSGVYGLQLIGDRVSVLANTGQFGGADYYLLQSGIILAPMLIVLGLATAVGTLFVLAARWKHRQPE
ncbi:MAG: hypothetical protein V4479_04620 [Actinomycetota bacterium]